MKDFWKNYNIYDAIKNIVDSWEEIKQSTMKGVWNKLCPHFCSDFLKVTERDIAETREAVVDSGNALQLDITEDDVIEKQLRETEEHEERELRKFTTKELAEAVRLIEAGLAKIEKQDSNLEPFTVQ
ncbi:hypothetical protein QE152_g28517 [Popillia japonica]|uniref:DDE-1 domain-containing protein n=1 Tax=Popillia japonica TaxID=7064 RepID=A0AAW1JLB6_POPJA